MKKSVYYSVWTIGFGVILFIGFKIQLHLQGVAATSFRLLPYMLYLTLFPIFIGVLLRMPLLIQEIKERKKWIINWPKLLIIGLPSLYITILPLLLFTDFGHSLPFAMNYYHIIGTNIGTIIGVVFGYILLDSFRG